MNNTNRKISEQMDPGFDGSEFDFAQAGEVQGDVSFDMLVDDVVGQVRKGAGINSQRKFSQFSLAPSVDDSKRPRRRISHHYPEDPAVHRSLKAAELLREREIRNGTHFSVTNFVESVDVPAGATHQITRDALEGQYVVIVGNGEKGSVKVIIVGGRRDGSPAFIMPKDLRKL